MVIGSGFSSPFVVNAEPFTKSCKKKIEAAVGKVVISAASGIGFSASRVKESSIMPKRASSSGYAVVLLSWLSAFAACVQGQEQFANGIIEGAVTDASGAVIPGANIEVKNRDTGLTRSG
jgi:hypothetical protein